MKKALLILVIIIFSAQLYSAEPIVTFYLQDGSSKQYNLSDIDSLNVIDQKNNYVMRIHYQDSLVAYYPNEIIGSIKFEKDSAKQDILNVYIFSFPKTYILSSIDSVIFYIDKYQPLTIGSQHWMLKNLNEDHYRNGDSIPEVRDSKEWAQLKKGEWCYYNNDPELGKIYGKLYNWYAVNDPRGLAPNGWHVPTYAEWSSLTAYIGDNKFAGGKLKSTGTNEAGVILWWAPNTGATNETGFTALPGGLRINYGAFNSKGDWGNWWTSTEFDTLYAWFRYLLSSSADIGNYQYGKENGFSVRCIKDK